MITGLDALTAKEKDALRLLLRGHDAKSSARELGLSVHTVNERLRDARRKLGVTSSREAARRLLAAEGETPETLGDRALGDALAGTVNAPVTASATRRWAGSGLALLAIGVLAMSLFLYALLAVWSPPTSEAGKDLPPASVNLDKVQIAAREWLALIDRGEWQASHTASGSAFRSAISASAWGQAAAQARQPLGRVVKRELLEYGSQSAPRETRIVLFRTDFANQAGATETVTLEREGDRYRVVGYWIK
ncbi:helix-turn-helix domain-containing protein [Porphyrobacter sp. AAP60]|uniref:helix-turn-helix domain-containing protein n=1 Tax=Porphyrobacter sp. AAP60 TaxID=1523423 RepID=UPI0006B93627|nr:DUF4019 domain-containing protein [Porphyrobacter sp. AAP60]KPF63890.1 hypothetical protein IP79_08740 [Porphyrobacter sp. AAP60]